MLAAKRSRACRSQPMSRARSGRFAPTAAPAIAVMSARSPVVALNPSHATDEGAGPAPAKPVVLVRPTSRGSPRRSRYRGRSARRPREPRAARRRAEAGQRRDDDQDAEEPAAQAEHDRVHRAERRAGLATEAVPACAPGRAIHSSERTVRSARPTIAPRDALAERGLRDLGREVDTRAACRASRRPRRCRGTC